MVNQTREVEDEPRIESKLISPANAMSTLNKEEVELLPETKFEYPSYIQNSDQDQPYKPSPKKKLTKYNQTTPALQDYIKGLQKNQKDYIKEQIKKEE